MHLRATRILAATLLASACGLAVGASKSTTFNVTATVVSNCFINSASTMAFGTYDGSADVDQSSSIVVRCSNSTPYGIGLDAGTATGSTIAQRTMTSATAIGSTLHYNLFNTAGRTTVWANPANAAAVATNQGGVGAGLGIPSSITHTVYGRLQNNATSQAAAPAADYTSAVTVTINY